MIWTPAEITLHVQNAYQALAQALPLFVDDVYLENLPATFSYTHVADLAVASTIAGFLDAGLATFTYEDERRLVGDERQMVGPANSTCPDEFTDGWLSAVGASVDVPATAELPDSLTALTRVTWDRRGLEALSPRGVAPHDGRYELTRGEVYGYLWRKDGLRTLRKVRRPAATASVVTVTGTSWGILRRPTDLSADAVTGGFGVPRRIPSHQPLGPETFGLPRRPYLDTKNVRAEFTRLGRPLVTLRDVSELPPRYSVYLRDAVQAQLLARVGPGQDLKLAAHFQARWARALARVASRVDRVTRERVSVLGGDGGSTVTRPPRPSRPWQYGAVVR